MTRELHPKGMFLAEITNHGFAQTEKGTLYFGVEFATIIDEQTTGKITGFFYMSDKAAEYTIQKIRAMGYQGDDLRELAKEPPALAGKTVKIVVEHREYEGSTRDGVASVFPADYEPGIRKDAEAAANVARFNALLAKYKGSKPAVDDDVPF